MITSDIEGRIESISGIEEVQFGDRSSRKRELVLAAETDKKYPTMIHATFWDDATKDLAGMQAGNFVKVRVSIRSKKKASRDGRAYWNTTLSGVRAKLLYGETAQPQQPTLRASLDDIPNLVRQPRAEETPGEEEIPF